MSNESSKMRYNAVQALKKDGIPEEDAPFVERYLAHLKEGDDNSYKNARDAILFFYEAIQKSVADFTADDARFVVDAILDMKRKPRTLKDGTVKINPRPIADSTKFSRYTLINTWVNRAKREFRADRGIIIENFFGDIDNPFTNPRKNSRIDEDAKIDTSFHDDEDTKALTKEEVKAILERARYEPRWFEIALKILNDTMWRGSEVLTLMIKNLNFETTIAASGIVKNARKEGLVKNPISRETLMDIKSYMLILKPGEKWLFPAKESFGHVKETYFCNCVAKFSKKIGIPFTGHSFRHTASHDMLVKGVEDVHRAILTNHATGSNVESKVYARRNITNKDRVELYNKYHP